AARGFSLTVQHSNRAVKVGLYALMGIFLTVNFGWEIYTARQVKRRAHFEDFLLQFERYVQGSPRERVFVSAKLKSALESLKTSLPENIVTRPDDPHTQT